MSAVTLSGVRKAFGTVDALAGVDLDVEPGAIQALLGPSGCGKTTLLRTIAGFERPDAGSITVAGEMVAGPGCFVPPDRRRIGMVFQDYALFPHLDVAGNVGYALGRRPSRERIAEVLELVGLAEVANRRVQELSGGQQQRVALARALAPRPPVILLDEPFSNLDAGLRGRLRVEMRDILRASGVTALFVTHDQEEALSIADRVAVMRDGLIEQVDTPEGVYGRPATAWVAAFVGEMELLPGTAGEGFVECELARFPIDAGFRGPAHVLIRPEALALGTGPAPGGHEASQGVVVTREFYGHDQLVEVELRSGRTLRSRRLGFPAWNPGDSVRVWVDGPVNFLPREDAAPAPEPAATAAAPPSGAAA